MHCEHLKHLLVLDLFFTFNYVSVHVCPGALKAEHPPGAGVAGGHEPPSGYWDLNSASLNNGKNSSPPNHCSSSILTVCKDYFYNFLVDIKFYVS